ncbi:phosphate ABC transporter permease PstA [Solirubrobacter ginsenosidimutans]|uniref:Phosphate transport system permease protein PstA n=1 Tax=Solirubrobacter ginsenosidimutans TaxID=490573 RepID=A0A9X3S2Q4_9ACTN|nr:phosphate ABC transporter permease PstA [Solirubrobacter ginsenosidimutans]MDA0161401.1 phosphate ABC transporter permease PstA [Solirubrobacter ginsenosidimutans]
MSTPDQEKTLPDDASTERDPTPAATSAAAPSKAAGSPATVTTSRPPTRPSVHAGTGKLPAWGPWGAIVGAAVVVGVILLVIGFNLALFIVATAVVGGIALYVWSRSVEGKRHATDRAVTYVVTAAFLTALAPLVSLLFTVIKRGAARFDYDFFTLSMRGVIGEGGGALHAIEGTLIITGCATIISVPIGILAAIYLQEYGKGRLRSSLTFFVDVMTGIPSIVAGLFAFALFSIFFGPGVRMGIMGSIALSVLMIPIVVRSTEEMLRIVPNSLREASYALGISKSRTILKVVLPTALAGIVTGVVLAIARIIGETAPLLITTGVVASMNANPFDGRMSNLAVFAFNSYKSPGVPPQPSIDRAWTAALVLILIVMVLNVAARLIYRRFGTEIKS